MRHFLLLSCFFLSGLSGLVYQIVWTRLVGHVFGNSVYATATVLAAFMGGLALGSFLGGKLADRREDRVRVYGVLELAIGLYCAVLPLLLALATPVYAAVYQWAEGTSVPLVLLRAAICGLILLAPTTCMGATLPLLLRHFVTTPEGIGRTVGVVYAINTFGAVLGALLTGFFLIPAIGVTMTTAAAVALNVAVGLLAITYLGQKRWQGGQAASAQAPGGETQQPEEAPAVSSVWEVRIAVLTIGISGFVAMAYEVALTRTFSLLLGSSTYAFSLMLTAFITGIGLGSIILTRWVRPDRDLLLGLGLTQMGIGVSSLVMIVLIGEVPSLVVTAIAKCRGSFGALQAMEFCFLFCTMALPTSLLGLMFPLTTAICARDPLTVGRSSGKVYSVNTVGAIFGSLAGGFVFLPLLGVQATIESMAMLNFVAAAIVFAVHRRWPVPQRLVLIGVTVILGLVLVRAAPRWDLDRFTSGPYLYAASAASRGQDPEVAIAAVVRQQGQIIWNRDGTACTVTVKKLGEGLLQLSVNGKIDATSVEDQKTQKLIGHVPMLLHPAPEDVLVIGLGSGMTLSAVLQHEPQRADFVEISPDVVYAAEHFFGEYNDRALHHPRAHKIIGDGRNHVVLTNRAYDVIASEPSNPWIAGVGDLFTRDYWEECRKTLRRDGIMCQWVQAYQISGESFQLIARTFQDVFPHASLWFTAANDVLLIGPKQPIELDLKTLGRRLAQDRVSADLQKVDIWDVEALLSHFVSGSEGLRDFAGTGRRLLIHTDDNARLEFDMPREMFCDPSLLFDSIERFLHPPMSIVRAGGLEGGIAERLTRSQQAAWHLNRAMNLFRTAQSAKAFDRLDQAEESARDDPAALLSLLRFLCLHARKFHLQQRDRESGECQARLGRVRSRLSAAREPEARPSRRFEQVLKECESLRRTLDSGGNFP